MTYVTVDVEIDLMDYISDLSTDQLKGELVLRSGDQKTPVEILAENLYYALRDAQNVDDKLRTACEAIVDQLTDRIV